MDLSIKPSPLLEKLKRMWPPENRLDASFAYAKTTLWFTLHIFLSLCENLS